MPHATKGTAIKSPPSRCRGGNQKPNIVGARNAATSTCAPSATAHRSAADSARACCGSARASPSWRVRTSIQTPTPASTNTGAQRSSPNSRSIISATSR